MSRFGLDRHDPPVLGHSAREPDRRVAAERADFEYPPGARGPREQVQQLAVRGCDFDVGQSRRLLVGDRMIERGVSADEGVDQIAVDGTGGLGCQL